jgi:hypothetical protein
LDKTLAHLEQVLQQQLSAHEQLLALLQRKRQALREAAHTLVVQCCELENEKIRAISELEKARLELVGRLTQMCDPAATQPLRLAQLAEHLPEPARGRLLVLRGQLAARMEAVQGQTKITQRALESLHRHMQGLMMTVGSLCSGVATYSASGLRPRAATTMSTFSTTA